MNRYQSPATKRSQPVSSTTRTNNKEFILSDCYFQAIKENQQQQAIDQRTQVVAATNNNYTTSMYKTTMPAFDNARELSLSLPTSPPLSCPLSPIQPPKMAPTHLHQAASLSLQSLTLSSSSSSSSSASSLTTMSSSNSTTTSSFVIQASTSFKSSSSSSDNSHCRNNGNEFDSATPAGKKNEDTCSTTTTTNRSVKEIHLSYSAYLDSLRNKYKLNRQDSQEPSGRRSFQQFNKSASFYLSQQQQHNSHNKDTRQQIAASSTRYRHRTTDLCCQSGVPETTDCYLFSSNRAAAARQTATASYSTTTTTRLFPKSNSLFVPYKALDSFNERLVRNRSLASARDLTSGKKQPPNKVANLCHRPSPINISTSSSVHDDDQLESSDSEELTSVYLQTFQQTVSRRHPHQPFVSVAADDEQQQQHSAGLANESFFEQFIDSLDEINSYLESKLKRSDQSFSSSSPSSSSSSSSSASRRHQSFNSDAKRNCIDQGNEQPPLKATEAIRSRTDAPVIIKIGPSSTTFDHCHHFKEQSSSRSRRSNKGRYLTQPVNLEEAINYYPNKTITAAAIQLQLDDDNDDHNDGAGASGLGITAAGLRTSDHLNLDEQANKSTKPKNSIPFSNTFSHEHSLDSRSSNQLDSSMNMNKQQPNASSSSSSVGKKPAKNFVSLSDILSNKTGASTLSRNESVRSNAATTLRRDDKTKAETTAEHVGQSAQQHEPASTAAPPLFFDFLTVQALFKELELDCDDQIKKLDENEKSRKQIALEQKKILDEIRLRWVQSPDAFKLAKSVRSISCSCFSRTRRAGRHHHRAAPKLIGPHRKLFFKFKNSKLCVQNREKFVAKRWLSPRTLLRRLGSRWSLVVYVKYDRKFSSSAFCAPWFTRVRWSRRIDCTHLDALIRRNKSLEAGSLPAVQLRPKKRSAKRKKSRPSTRMLISQLPIIKMNSEQAKGSSDQLVINPQTAHSKTLLDKLYAKYCDQTSVDSMGFKEPPALKIASNGESESSSSSSASPPPPSSSTLLIRRKTKKYNNANLTMPLMSSLTSDLVSSNATPQLISKQQSDDETKDLEEFLNLIEACKWLIEAGYSTLVHSFLKSQHTKSNKGGDEKNRGCDLAVDALQLADHKTTTTTTTTTRTPTPPPPQMNDDAASHHHHHHASHLLESSFDDIIKEAYPQLQDHDLNAIYRRLEILHRSSASFIELDYDYLKDNYLSNQTEEEEDGDGEEYCEDQEEEAEAYNTNSSSSNIDRNELTSSAVTSKSHHQSPRTRTPSVRQAKMKIDPNPIPTLVEAATSPKTSFQKIQPVPTNNYYCIQFPLKTNTSETNFSSSKQQQQQQPTTNAILNSIICENAKKLPNLNRFHSFRLSDKISNNKCKPTSPLSSTSGPDTKGYLDLANVKQLSNSNETSPAPAPAQMRAVKTGNENLNPEKLYLYAIRNYNSQMPGCLSEDVAKPAVRSAADKYTSLGFQVSTPSDTDKSSSSVLSSPSSSTSSSGKYHHHHHHASKLLDVDVSSSSNTSTSSYDGESNNTTTPLSYSPISSSPPPSPQTEKQQQQATDEDKKRSRRATVVISFKNAAKTTTVESQEQQQQTPGQPAQPSAAKPRHFGSVSTTLNSSAGSFKPSGAVAVSTRKPPPREWEEQLPKIELSTSLGKSAGVNETLENTSNKYKKLDEELESFKLKSKNSLKLADLTHDFTATVAASGGAMPKSPKSANSLSTPTSSTSSSGSSPGSALFSLSLSPTSASQFEYSSPSYLNTKYNDVKNSAGLISEHKKTPRKFNTVGSSLIQKPIRNQMFQMSSSSPTRQTDSNGISDEQLATTGRGKLENSFESLNELNMKVRDSPDRSEDSSCGAAVVVDLNNNATSTARRERRDSGMGGSLTRGGVGGRRRNREKWSSFVRSHRASFKSSKLQLNAISVRQFSKLKKFAHVRITGLMEKYSPNCQKSGWNRFKTVPRFIRRHQKPADASVYKNKQVFSVPLKVNYQRHGQPLPQPIIQIMRYLRKNAASTVGIFRKSGSKARMGLLRETIERTNTCDLSEIEKKLSALASAGADNSLSNSSSTNLHIGTGGLGSAASTDLSSIGSGFSSQSTSKSDLIDELSQPAAAPSVNNEMMAIDVADILKQYFRELPECLFTNKISQMLIDIFTFFPENERLEAVQYCMMLIDDENRDALQCLLYLLHDIAQSHSVHKMDVRNIAICLAPTLLNMNSFKDLGMPSHTPASASPTSPITKDTAALMNRQCNASLDCLTMMIENPKRVFQIPIESFTKCQFTKMDYTTSLTLAELLGSYSLDVLNIYVDDRINEMIRELKERPRSWNRLRNDSSVEIHYKDLENDEHELRLWKLTIELEASPSEVLDKLVKWRSQWDDELAESKVVEYLDSRTDVYQYVMNLMAPQPSRDFCELRAWREGYQFNSKPAQVVFSTSIEHEKAKLMGDIRANTLRNFYLIEPISENKCKLHQLYRADYRGYSIEWYNKIQGHLIKRQLTNLRECLKTSKTHL